MLELVPWSGKPDNLDEPSSAMRRFVFGPDDLGMVVYLVLDVGRHVDIVRVHWLG